jgi:hypothetical protein
MYDADAPFHWFVVDSMNWVTDSDLGKAIARHKRVGGRHWSPRNALIYRVPADVDAEYEISNYVPQVEGTVVCGHVAS